ncbi:ACT domain-containing protein [Sporomusa aerivorans]|uniref:ACT domain-containing protein n=1 Tax=Sporomusa aerivorans TaxID=204936 RepID=UPI00352A289A
MIIHQLSVFVENQPGKLAEVLGVLHTHEINLRAMAVADTADFGILRIIVNEPEKVQHILRGAGFTVKITPVLSIVITDQPGCLFEQVSKLSSAGVNVEYVYAFAATSSDTARVVLKVDNLPLAERLINGEEKSKACYRDETGTTPNFYW